MMVVVVEMVKAEMGLKLCGVCFVGVGWGYI